VKVARKSNRVAGHSLRHEGRVGADPYRPTNGEGKCRCECGAWSPTLPSTAKRQQWHRDHKDDIRAGGSGAVWQDLT
jgi:hypothetical protein